MRNRFFVALTALLLTFTISSCKKENSTNPTLVGKWKVSKIIEKEDGVSIDIYNGVLTDFYEFKSNGTYEYSVDGDVDSGTYVITGSSVFIDGEQYEIQNLTNSSVNLSYEEVVDAVVYEEIISLKR